MGKVASLLMLFTSHGGRGGRRSIHHRQVNKGLESEKEKKIGQGK
jgi:hypothetical protein